MAARVDLAVQLFPGVIAAPLVLGSIAGTGGRFSIDPILAAIGELPGTRGPMPEAVFQGLVLRWWLRACPVQWQCMGVFAVRSSRVG